MALPGQGNSLSISQIGQELGLGASNLSLRNLSATAGFGTPDAISEFFGYSVGGGGNSELNLLYQGIYFGHPCNGRYGDLYTHTNGGYYELDNDNNPVQYLGPIYVLIDFDGNYTYDVYFVKDNSVDPFGPDKSPCGPFN